MVCKLCGSNNQAELAAEINVHHPGLQGIDQPALWAFPKLAVCLDCGYTAFTLTRDELRNLTKTAA
jgi:hypothetical protein